MAVETHMLSIHDARDFKWKLLIHLFQCSHQSCPLITTESIVSLARGHVSVHHQGPKETYHRFILHSRCLERRKRWVRHYCKDLGNRSSSLCMIKKVVRKCGCMRMAGGAKLWAEVLIRYDKIRSICNIVVLLSL